MNSKLGSSAVAAMALALSVDAACSSTDGANAGDGGTGGASAATGGTSSSTGGSSGGSRASGGAPSGGDGGSGGRVATGGVTGSGGTSATGGTSNTGGSSSTGGSASGGSGGKCISKANTPGGPDPWGGCFPGDYNTGYPRGLPGDTRTPVTLTAYDGPCSIKTDDTVIDGKRVDNCSDQGLFIYAKRVTIKNSLVNTEIYENDDAASVTVMDTEVNGGNQYTFPAIGGANNVTAIRVNSHDGEHTVHCYSNCVVQDSWLHDQHEAGAGPHQNGFLSNGGSNFRIEHSSVGCSASGCTAAITFIPDGNVSKATVSRNLVIASPKAGYCMDVASNHPGKPGIVSQMTVTDNVFQRGTTRGEHGDFVCGYYGAVGGWDRPNDDPGTDGYLNVWSNNAFDDGTAITP